MAEQVKKKPRGRRKKVKEAELESLQKQGSTLTVTNQTEGASLGNLFTANQPGVVTFSEKTSTSSASITILALPG